MAGMGPPPKPTSTRSRRNGATATTKLSAAGRVGAIPAWPLPDDVVMKVKARMAGEMAERLQAQLEECEDGRKIKRLERELQQALTEGCVLDAQIAELRLSEESLWDELWRTPQAAIWEQLAWGREVAQYVRWKVRGEAGDIDAAKEARMWSDRLGLNPLAMLRLRWEIERTEDAENRGEERRARRAAPKATKPAADPRSALRAV